MSMNRRRLLPLVALFLGAALAACGTSREDPPAPQEITASDYVIGPGDSFSVFVWRNPELSTGVQVRPDGKISIPLVEDMPVSGKTPTEVARALEEKLAVYVQDPVVTVIMSGFAGPFDRQIRVLGEAAQPQALPYRDTMTLLDVLIAVGGITEFADGNGATLTRVVDGEATQYGLRIDDLLQEGDMTANVPMLPGDVVVIPESFF
jgi:polysaccharide export outer membrane protein